MAGGSLDEGCLVSEESWSENYLRGRFRAVPDPDSHILSDSPRNKMSM